MSSKSDFELASIESRFIALLIDLTFLLLAFIGIAIAVEEFGEGKDPKMPLAAWFSEEFGSIDSDSVVRISIILPIITFFYWIFWEAFRNGQTLGKKAIGIRVVKFDQMNGEISRCTPHDSMVRNLLRIIDTIPFLYIIGVIFAKYSNQKQRIGDRIAGTIVIKAKKPIYPNF